LADEIEDADVPPEGSRDENPAIRIPNAADPVAIGRAQQRAKHLADKRADFWKRVLSEEIGRAVLWDVLQSLSTFEARFATGPNGFPYPEAAWFQAGEQSAGWRIYDALRKADFEAVHLMHQEHDSYFIEKKARSRKTP
jgi:hypothetical protein